MIIVIVIVIVIIIIVKAIIVIVIIPTFLVKYNRPAMVLLTGNWHCVPQMPGDFPTLGQHVFRHFP